MIIEKNWEVLGRIWKNLVRLTAGSVSAIHRIARVNERKREDLRERECRKHRQWR